MRISDWSSDVCSSDLKRLAIGDTGRRFPQSNQAQAPSAGQSGCRGLGNQRSTIRALFLIGRRQSCGHSHVAAPCLNDARNSLLVERSATDLDRRRVTTRSEEHTSELQSLMRNSYAVFCLKKKN